MELISMTSQKIANWEERSLQGAASFRTLVPNFGTNLATGHPTKSGKESPTPSL